MLMKQQAKIVGVLVEVILKDIGATRLAWLVGIWWCCGKCRTSGLRGCWFKFSFVTLFVMFDEEM